MVGATGIEPVTPTMSTQRADRNYSKIPASYPPSVRKRSRSDHGNLGRFLGAVVQRDNGLWSLGWHDDAPGAHSPARSFAEAVRLRQTRHQNHWLKQ